MQRPTRSVLYIPASRPRAMEKAHALPCDAIIFDLEDAVSPDEKHQARTQLREALGLGGFGARLRLVRINGLNTDWGPEDARMVADMPCDGILLPKVERPEEVDDLLEIVQAKPVWCMIETPCGVLNVAAIASHPQVSGLVVGANDLAKEMMLRAGAERPALMTALHMIVLAARAHGVVALDGVYNVFRDEEGLAAECAEGRDMGFDGKTLIHPSQITAANAAFAPEDAELDLARRQIAAHDAALAEGQGVAVVDGRIVEGLHVEAARRLLAQAEAIAKMEAEQ